MQQFAIARLSCNQPNSMEPRETKLIIRSIKHVQTKRKSFQRLKTDSKTNYKHCTGFIFHIIERGFRNTMDSCSWDEITSCDMFLSSIWSPTWSQDYPGKFQERKFPRKRESYWTRLLERFVECGRSDVWTRKSIEELKYWDIKRDNNQ